MIAAEGKKNDHQKTKNGLHRSSVSGPDALKKTQTRKISFLRRFFFAKVKARALLKRFRADSADFQNAQKHKKKLFGIDLFYNTI
jgi:hypothetical protein